MDCYCCELEYCSIAGVSMNAAFAALLFFIFICSRCSSINVFHLNSNRKSRIDLETSIVPMATLEVGLIEMEQGNYDTAKKWFDSAEKDFSGYTAENFVHIKAYAAIRRMGYKTDKEKEDKEKCKSLPDSVAIWQTLPLILSHLPSSEQTHPQLAGATRDRFQVVSRNHRLQVMSSIPFAATAFHLISMHLQW